MFRLMMRKNEESQRVHDLESKSEGAEILSMQEIARTNPIFIYSTFFGKIIFEGFILKNIVYVILK